jgi:hypothetical protein
MLPALVEVEVNKLIETDHRLVDELRAETRAALRELKDVALHRLENKLMTELRVAVATVKANPRPPVAPPPDATKMDSFERRLSRNADHVQRLEDRIRKLEGRA